jgi:hypothetical protein
MRTLQRIVVASCLLVTTISLRAELSARAWLETYYLNPAPALVPQAVTELSRDGYFDRRENVVVAIGFLAALIERHPGRVDAWLQELAMLPLAHRRLVASALWQAGHPSAEQALRQLGQTSPLREEVEKLAAIQGRTVTDTPVRSPSSMRLRWGAFLATGDERHVIAILEAFGLNEPGLNSAARMSLAQHAAAHPRIMEICRAQLDRQPEEIRSELRAALHQASSTAAPRS